VTTQLQLIHIIIIIIIIIIDLNGSGYMAREQESICYGVLCWTDGEEVDCLNVHLPHERMWNANFMQLRNFIDIFLARHFSGTYAAWVVCMVLLTVYTTHAAALKTTTHPKTRCKKPYAATQHLRFLMLSVRTRNMSG